MTPLEETCQAATALVAEAAALLGVDASEVSWYCWPETFGSTAGPHGGIGGQAMTNFQVFGFQTLNPKAKYGGGIMACAGRWRGWRDQTKRMWHR